MGTSEKKKKRGENFSEEKIFLVPFTSEEIKENVIININTPLKFSKEQIIKQAFKFHSQGEISEAGKYYQIFIDQGFLDHRVFCNYGNILKDLGKLHDAELLTRKAIEIKPNNANAYSHLGSILSDLGKLKEAELALLKAIEIQPNFANAYSNLGAIFKDLGKLNDAESVLKKAIEIQPDFADAYCNLSFIELLKGNYQSGLENYEFRFKKKKPVLPHGKTKIKKIGDKGFPTGKKLLVITEQGLGDTLQYMRYIPYLKNQGFDISFCAQKKLHSLIKESNIDADPLTPKQANMISEGQWIPLLSLPKFLKVTPQNPIISQPYISSTNQLKNKWKKILFKEKRPVIGINWQGNPDMESFSYQGRSIPLEKFSTLLECNQITMLSLQKGFGSEQLQHCSFKNKFVECQPQIDSTWDFLENAAIIQNCDLIITCDTAIAHLAGGIGKSTFLLLRKVPDWRWGMEGKSIFWYPSMKLFRQKKQNDWNEVMKRVSIGLKKELEAKI